MNIQSLSAYKFMLPTTVAAVTSFHYWRNQQIASIYYGRITPLLYAFDDFFDDHQHECTNGRYAFRDFSAGQIPDPVEIELSTLPHNTLPTKLAGIITLIVIACICFTEKSALTAAALSILWTVGLTFYSMRQQNKLHHLKERTLHLSKTRWQCIEGYRQLEYNDQSNSHFYLLQIQDSENNRLGSFFFKETLLNFNLKHYSFKRSLEASTKTLKIPIVVEKMCSYVFFNSTAAQKYRALQMQSIRKRFT